MDVNPSRWSIKIWLALLVAVFVLFEVNAIKYGDVLSFRSPLAPDTATGQVNALPTGNRDTQRLVYVTDGEMLTLNFWLGGGMVAFLSVLAIPIVHGFSLEMERRRTRLSRVKRRPPKR